VVPHDALIGRDDLIEAVAASIGRRRGVVLTGAPGVGVSSAILAAAARAKREHREVRVVRMPDHRATVFDGTEQILVVDDAHLADRRQTLQLRDAAIERTVVLGVHTGVADDALAWLWQSGLLTPIVLPPLDVAHTQLVVERSAAGSVHRSVVDRIHHHAGGRPGFVVDEVGPPGVEPGGNSHTSPRVTSTGAVETRVVDRARSLVRHLHPRTVRDIELIAQAGAVSVELAGRLDIDTHQLERRQLATTVEAPNGRWVMLDPPILAAAIRMMLTPSAARRLAARLVSFGTDGLTVHDRVRLHLELDMPIDAKELEVAAQTALHNDETASALRLASLAGRQGTRGRMTEAGILRELGRRSDAAERYAVLRLDADTTVANRTHAAAEYSSILLWDLARPQEAVDVAAALAAEQVGGPSEHAALTHLAAVHMYCGSPLRALEVAERVDRSSLDLLSFGTISVVHSVSTAMTDPAAMAGATLIDWRGALLDRSVDAFEPAIAVVGSELTLELAGRYTEALDLVREARAELGIGVTPGSIAWLSLAECRAELAVGRPACAVRAATEAADCFQAVMHPSGQRWAVGGLLLACALLGDADGCRRALAEADRLGPGVPFLDADLLRARAWATSTLGDSVRAETLFSDAAQCAADAGAVALEAVALHDAFRVLGKRFSTRLAVLAQQSPAPSIVLRARHVQAGDDADELLVIADEFERIGALLIAAELVSQASVVAAAEGQRSLARTAHGHFLRLDEACGRVRSRWQHDVVELTARERDVATLASGGQTSRAIAQHLGVSTRTVDNMLQRVYVKLGLHGRSELIARFALVDVDRSPL